MAKRQSVELENTFQPGAEPKMVVMVDSDKPVSVFLVADDDMNLCEVPNANIASGLCRH